MHCHSARFSGKKILDRLLAAANKEQFSMISRRSFLVFSAIPALRAAEDSAWVTKLGGQVRRDASGNVREVNLRGCWVSTAEVLDLLQYKKLVRLNLSLTRI